MSIKNIYSGGALETIVASAARTVSGNSGPIDGVGGAKTLRVQLDVTAAAGTTPNLAVLIEDTLDAGASWNSIGTFAARVAAGREVINITSPFSSTIRVSWAITGTTPSFTFSVVAFAE